MSDSYTPSSENEDVAVEKFKPSARFMAAFTSLAIVNLACALDATDIGVALPVITRAIGGNAVQALWMGTSFLLASTVWQPLFVAVSDVFGRRPLLILALILFTAGSIMCAVCNGPGLMLAGRSVQGSGVGGVLTLTEAIITDLVPLRERGNFIALISIVWAVGTVAGPLVGGALAQNGDWRWIFYLNLPILGIGFVGVTVFLNQDLRQRALLEKLRKIDYVGSFLFVSSLTSMLIPLSWGGTMYAWSSWRTLVPLILGIAGLIVFTVHQIVLGSESRPADKRLDTLLPMRIFGNRSTSITYMNTFLHGMILWALVYYMPLYFQAAKSYTPIQTGLTALPQTLTVVPCAMVVGVVASKTGRYRWSLYIGFAITTLGMGLLYLLGVDTKIVEWVFLLLVGGIGIGLLFPGMNLSIQSSVPNQDIAIAAGLFTFFRAAGQSVGVAVGEAIFQNRLERILAPYPDLHMTSLDAISIIGEISSLPPFQSNILKHAYADAIKVIWATMCGLSGLALIATFFVKEYTLDQMLAGEQGFVDSDKTKKSGATENLSSDEAEKAVPGSNIGEARISQ